MRVWTVMAALFAALILQTSASWAVDIRSGRAVVLAKDQTVDDDIVAAAGQVSLAGPVNGDVVAAGSSVGILGRIKDSVFLAGKNVTVAAPVGNDSWLAGETVVVASKVADNGFMAGDSVTLSRDGSVGTDLLAAGSKVTVLGTVGRNLRAGAEELVIGGRIGRNVYAKADKITVMKGAVIEGDLRYESGRKAVVEPGAKIIGKTVQSLPKQESVKPVFWGPFVWILCLLMAIVFGAALIVVFPNRSQGTADTVRDSFWSSVGLGIAALVGAPVLVVILLITIIGVPLGLAALAVYAVLLYAAWILGALALGQWILGRGRTVQPRAFGSMILGLVILAVLGLIPYVGGVFKLIAMLAGLGAFLISWWRSRSAATAA